jgi:hypothetical protein
MVAWRGPSEDVNGAVAFLGLEVGRVDPSIYMRYFLHVVSMKTILTGFQAMSVSLLKVRIVSQRKPYTYILQPI